MSFTNTVLKTRKKQDWRKLHWKLHDLYSKHISGSLIETGRACDTHVEKKNILRVDGERNETTTKAWAY
jgi:hypothetical protein